MKQGLIFASSRAKAKELNLFTEERLYRMMESKTLTDAVRVLAEANYADGENVNTENFYEILEKEERSVTAFVRETAPKGVGIECFFCRNDYHNLKVLLKARYVGIEDYTGMLLPDGNYVFADLKERYENNTLSITNKYMGEALAIINREFESGNRSPRLIDVELDKAMYREISDILKGKNTDIYIKKYFENLIDTSNIGSMLRTINIGAGFAFFEQGFLTGGKLSLNSFKECGTDTAKFGKFINGTDYKELYEKVKEKDLSGFETAKDNYLLKIFAVNKSDMFSVAPIVGYYLGKLNEIKVLRVVLICIKNNVSLDEMKKRVRMLYA